MLSSRYFKMAAGITALARKIGATILVLGENNVFHNSSDKKCIKRWKSTYNMLCLWLTTGFFLIFKFWYERNFERYILSLFYFIGGSAAVLVMFSIFRWYLNDGCRVINGLLEFLKYFQSNPIHTTLHGMNYFKDLIYHVLYRNLHAEFWQRKW